MAYLPIQIHEWNFAPKRLAMCETVCDSLNRLRASRAPTITNHLGTAPAPDSQQSNTSSADSMCDCFTIAILAD
jgi:hypothetical protein